MLTNAGTATLFTLRLRLHSKGAHAASVLRGDSWMKQVEEYLDMMFLGLHGGDKRELVLELPGGVVGNAKFTGQLQR